MISGSKEGVCKEETTNTGEAEREMGGTAGAVSKFKGRLVGSEVGKGVIPFASIGSAKGVGG